MSLIKTLFINVALIIIIILGLELSIRSAKTFQYCLTSCNYFYLANLKIFSTKQNSIGLIRLDKELGYVLKANFDKELQGPYWQNSRVTIDSDGFRKHSSEHYYNSKLTLAVGDSFTFGDQVSNDDTWPACLEYKLGSKVVNAGVYGYGSAQSLKRAQILLEDLSYNRLIISILVNSGFRRDARNYRDGFPKPALITNNHNVYWSQIPENFKSGTKFNPKKYSNFYYYLMDRSYLATFTLSNLGFDISGSSLTTNHEFSSSKAEAMSFFIKTLDDLKIEEKYLLLQYSFKDINDLETQTERNWIKQNIENTNISMIDTYAEISSYEPDLIWNLHHTKLGNKIVCELIYKKLLESNKYSN